MPFASKLPLNEGYTADESYDDGESLQSVVKGSESDPLLKALVRAPPCW